MTRYFNQKDVHPDALKGQKITVVGYGSQGHAHALNLRDSGAKNLVIALRDGSPSAKKAEAEGRKGMGISEAAAWCDLIMFTMPDELQAATYIGMLRVKVPIILPIFLALKWAPYKIVATKPKAKAD